MLILCRLQFLGDVAAHVGLAVLMMALVLGFFSPKTSPGVELLVLILFACDEVRARETSLRSTMLTQINDHLTEINNGVQRVETNSLNYFFALPQMQADPLFNATL